MMPLTSNKRYGLSVLSYKFVRYVPVAKCARGTFRGFTEIHARNGTKKHSPFSFSVFFAQFAVQVKDNSYFANSDRL